MEKMEKAKKHATHGITGFELIDYLLQNVYKYNLTHVEKHVLFQLARCYNPKNQYVFPRQKILALKINASERSVVRAIQSLVKEGLIIVECNLSNRYAFTPRILSEAAQSQKKFYSEIVSDDNATISQEDDTMSDSCIEPVKETKKEQQKSDFGNFICNFGEKIANSENKMSENDKLLLKAVENKPWIKNKVAYINKVKQASGADSLIKEGKALIESENHNKAMLKQTEIITKQREIDAKLAEPPSDSWKEFGRKHGICKLC